MVNLSKQVTFFLSQWYKKLKNQDVETIEQNNGKFDFLYDLNNFNKNWGWRVGSFILSQNWISSFLQHQNINHRQVCLYYPSIYLT